MKRKLSATFLLPFSTVYTYTNFWQLRSRGRRGTQLKLVYYPRGIKMSAREKAPSKKKAVSKKKAPPKETHAPPKESKKEFVWSDDEAELLLNVTNDYKVTKVSESIDWESVRSKYKDIFDLFVASLPEENTDITRDFPHKKEEIKLSHVTSKLKGIRLKFRQAVDSGRRSGHGRVVMIYYELCEKIWGGSPATEQIDGGIETVELNDDDSTMVTNNSSESTSSSTGGDITSNDADIGTSDTNSLSAHVSDEVRDNDEQQDETDQQDEAGTTDDNATIKKRREFLDEKLKNYRQTKLKRKLPTDAQMLNCAQEELAMKKRLMEQIDKMDCRYADNMEKMSQNMEKLTNSIADGFTLLKQLVTYQQPIYHSQPYNPYMQGSPSSYATPIANFSPSTNHCDRTSLNQPYDTYED